MTSAGERVAFVGLGDMGLPMATRLLGAGFEVVGCDLRLERADAFLSAGGQAERTARAAAEGASAVVVIPFDGAQVEEILLGADGALGSLRPGATVVVMATIG